MSQMMDHIEYLTKQIGPRPAGTEEEQQAALYITEQFQKDAGFTANIEDFSSSSNVEAGLATLAGVAVVATILAIIFPVLSIPAFILAAAAAAVYSLESFDRPIISRVLSRGASQNVVAKYQPGGDQPAASPRGRSRKIILVAHYDTGRVTPPLVSRIDSSGLPVALICVVGMIAAAFFLLIRIFVANGGGMGLLVLNVLSILAILVCLVPIVKAVLLRSAPYNEGSINNASGTAALLEIARRIARGSVSEAELAFEADDELTIHGEAAAREAGLIPEGVQIRYEAEKLAPPSEIGDYSEEERLLSAKAAIAALTGKPVERRVFGSVADNLVNSRADDAASSNEEVLEEVMAPVSGVSVSGAPARDFSSVPGVSAPEPTVAAPRSTKADGFENAPSWFVAAQQNARKTERYNADEGPQVKRSRYTEAIENAERSLADREEEARAAEWAKREEEARAALAANESQAEVAESPAEQVEPRVEMPAEEPAVQPVEPTVQLAEPAAPVAQSPYGTVAIPAPVPAAEIRAEADNLEAVQPAPEPEADPLAHDRVSKLPSIDPSNPYNSAPTTNPSRSGILRKLRTNIPSLSGLIAPVPSESASDKPRPRVTVPAVDTGSASNSVASSAPEPVEIPRSRSGNLLNKLRREEDEELSDTPQQWLNVDDDFEARSVGRARGSWESFRDDQYADDFDQPNGGEGKAPGRTWQGGAFSRVQLGHVNMRSGVEEPAEEYPSDSLDEPAVGPMPADDIEQIYHFRNPRFNTEIWFVAMGADGVSHDGARAFLAEHQNELRGSMIIEIESLGAGVLSVASEEGAVRKVAASSRIKRYTRAATAETGIAVDNVSLAGTDSIASTLQKAGFQTMHLFGAEDGRPALKGSADDVLENVDENALAEHVGFVFELLKG